MGKWLHRISNVNIEAKTGTCSRCGKNTRIYTRPSMKGYWACNNARIESRKKYYKEHPEKHKQSNTLAYKAACSKRRIRRNAVIRLECIEHYGGKCVICGDTNTNHLTFDHINNDGKEQRKTIPTSRFPRYLKRMGYPDYIQLLCWNHNLEKSIYGVMTI